MALIRRFWNFLIEWAEAIAQHRRQNGMHDMY